MITVICSLFINLQSVQVPGVVISNRGLVSDSWQIDFSKYYKAHNLPGPYVQYVNSNQCLMTGVAK